MLQSGARVRGNLRPRAAGPRHERKRCVRVNGFALAFSFLSMARALVPAWGDENVGNDFSAQHMKEKEAQREKEERAQQIKCDHLRERIWNAVELGDDDAIFLVIRAVDKDDTIDSMKEIIDPVTEDGVTPVYKACKNGNAECARQLMVAGAAAGRATKAGKLTPLFAAASSGKPSCVELLLQQRDTRIDYRTADGRTALYAASEAGNVECVKLLLGGGANVDAKRKDGSTPLIVASYLGNAGVVEALLNAGAKLKLRDEDGTALTNAQNQKQTACVELLSKAWKLRGAMEDAVEDEAEPIT